MSIFDVALFSMPILGVLGISSGMFAIGSLVAYMFGSKALDLWQRGEISENKFDLMKTRMKKSQQAQQAYYNMMESHYEDKQNFKRYIEPAMQQEQMLTEAAIAKTLQPDKTFERTAQALSPMLQPQKPNVPPPPRIGSLGSVLR